MKLARFVLISSALVFLAVGVGFLVIPVEWASLTEISLPTAMSRTDLRATYGGLDFAVGVFLIVAARRNEWVRPGLLVLALAAAGFATGRVIGFIAEGSAGNLMLLFLAIEFGVVAVALLALRRVSRATLPSP